MAETACQRCYRRQKKQWVEGLYHTRSPENMASRQAAGVAASAALTKRHPEASANRVELHSSRYGSMPRPAYRARGSYMSRSVRAKARNHRYARKMPVEAAGYKQRGGGRNMSHRVAAVASTLAKWGIKRRSVGGMKPWY